MKLKIETDLQAAPGGGMVWMSSTTAAKVQAELDAVNGAAKAFTVNYANDVYHLALQGERYLKENGVPVSDRSGATITFHPAGPEKSAYKHSAASTEFTLTRGGTHWYLIGVRRVDVYQREPKKCAVTISDTAAENLIKRTLAVFGRKPQYTSERVAQSIHDAFHVGESRGLLRAAARPSA